MSTAFSIIFRRINPINQKCIDRSDKCESNQYYDQIDGRRVKDTAGNTFARQAFPPPREPRPQKMASASNVWSFDENVELTRNDRLLTALCPLGSLTKKFPDPLDPTTANQARPEQAQRPYHRQFRPRLPSPRPTARS